MKQLVRQLPIIVVLAAYLALALAYNAAIPLGEGPDEPGHAAYAFFLARAGRLPVLRMQELQTDVQGEGHQPPLAYLLAAPLALGLPPEQRSFEWISNTAFSWAGGADANAVSHGTRELWPWQGAALSWHLMRALSALIGAASVGFTYAAARILARGWWPASERGAAGWALLAAGLVAFNPQFLFISALMTNDALLTLLSAGLFWLVIQLGSAPARRLGGAAAIGAVLGLALLTKQSAFMLLPLAMLGVLGGCTEPLGLRSRLWRAWQPALAMLGTALLIAGWWYWRNQRLYGDLFGLAAFRGEFTTQPFQIGSPAAWGAALVQLHNSFWACFGWMNVAPPGWVLGLIAAIELLALLGLGRSLYVARRRPAAATPRQLAIGPWALISALALAFAWIISFAVTVGLVAWQGRLIFPALPMVAILLSHGLAASAAALAPHLRQARWLPLGVQLAAVGLLFGIAAWIPGGVLRPTYRIYPQSAAEAQTQIATPTYGLFRESGEDGIELHGWRIDGMPRASGTLTLTLVWFAPARQIHNWDLASYLLDSTERAHAEDHHQPFAGAFPTTQWNAGDWIIDQHTLALPADLADGSYTLRVDVYDSQDINQRAGLYNAKKKLVGQWLDLGSIIVGGS